MKTLTVSLDSSVLARVRTDGFEVMSIHVGGTRIEEELAHLDMSASGNNEDKERNHLIWINSVSLRPGQTVQVQFSDEGDTTHPGKTIEELFPDEEEGPEIDFKTTTNMFAELRARPSLRERYNFSVRLPSGDVRHSASTPDEHGFGFTVLWNSSRPERARLSLHTYTIDDVEHRLPGRDHVREYIESGVSVAIAVDA